jgi:WD40 repeat protein
MRRHAILAVFLGAVFLYPALHAENPGPRPRLVLKGPNSCNCVAFSPDGKMIAAGYYDTSVFLWDPANGKLLRKVDDGRYVTAVLFSPDGKTLVTGSYTQIKLWDRRTNKELAVLDHFSELKAVAIRPDRRCSPGLATTGTTPPS